MELSGCGCAGGAGEEGSWNHCDDGDGALMVVEGVCGCDVYLREVVR